MLEDISSEELNVGKLSLLDKEYKKLFESKKIHANTVEKAEMCELEYMLIKHLIKEDEHLLTKEIKYRLTDGEEPITVLLSVLRKREDLRGVLWMIESKLEEFTHDNNHSR